VVTFATLSRATDGHPSFVQPAFINIRSQLETRPPRFVDAAQLLFSPQ
jgi:hypothetical protein